MRLLSLAALLTLAAATPAQQPDFASFERRLTDVERRLEALETHTVPRSPAAPASFAAPAAQQQRYAVDAGGVYWPAGTMPAAGYGVPAAYYGGGFGQPVSGAYTFGGGFGDAGGCAGGNCGGSAGVFGLGQPVRSLFRGRR